MTDDFDTTALDAAIRTLLGARPSVTRRRQVADLLWQRSQQQRETAAAEERSGVRFRAIVAREAVNADRPRGGRPKGSGGRYVNVARLNRTSIRFSIQIAPALYQEIGESARVTLRRDAQGRLIIAATRRGG